MLMFSGTNKRSNFGSRYNLQPLWNSNRILWACETGWRNQIDFDGETGPFQCAMKSEWHLNSEFTFLRCRVSIFSIEDNVGFPSEHSGGIRSRSNSYLCNASAVSIWGQQDQPVPGVTEANNLNKSIIDKR